MKKVFIVIVLFVIFGIVAGTVINPNKYLPENEYWYYTNLFNRLWFFGFLLVLAWSYLGAKLLQFRRKISLFNLKIIIGILTILLYILIRLTEVAFSELGIGKTYIYNWSLKGFALSNILLFLSIIGFNFVLTKPINFLLHFVPGSFRSDFFVFFALYLLIGVIVLFGSHVFWTDDLGWLAFLMKPVEVIKLTFNWPIIILLKPYGSYY